MIDSRTRRRFDYTRSGRFESHGGQGQVGVGLDRDVRDRLEHGQPMIFFVFLVRIVLLLSFLPCVQNEGLLHLV